jgi:hypothetical protein
VSFTVKGTAPRACTHITTTAGEGDQLASALAELIRQP